MDTEITKLPIEENLTSEDLNEPEKLAKFIVSILDSKRAKGIKLLHVEKQTVIADYFVICTGNSRTQIRAFADEVEFKLSQYGIAPSHVEGTDSGVWVLQDFNSVIVHIFTSDGRDYYKLEKLYQETTEKDIKGLITEE